MPKFGYKAALETGSGMFFSTKNVDVTDAVIGVVVRSDGDVVWRGRPYRAEYRKRAQLAANRAVSGFRYYNQKTGRCWRDDGDAKRLAKLVEQQRDHGKREAIKELAPEMWELIRGRVFPVDRVEALVERVERAIADRQADLEEKAQAQFALSQKRSRTSR